MAPTVPIRAEAIPAWLALQGALTDAEVPCRGRDEWVSESDADRQYAAGHCIGCPAFGACGAYALTAGERFGTWAGVDRTPVRDRTTAATDLGETA